MSSRKSGRLRFDDGSPESCCDRGCSFNLESARASDSEEETHESIFEGATPKSEEEASEQLSSLPGREAREAEVDVEGFLSLFGALVTRASAELFSPEEHLNESGA